jgi:urease accessory protein
MLVVDSVLGNVEADPDLAARREERPAEEIERVVLDERDRRRARLRTATEAGTDIGIVAPEDGLRPGDVLVDDDERMVVVDFADRDALVVDFADVDGTGETLATAAALGHELGNRHRDLAVRESEVLVALGPDAEQIRETVESAAPAGVAVRRETVDPALFDGTGAHSHGHGGESGHTHGHAHGDHTHEHAHHGGVHTIDDAGPDTGDGTGEGSS